jgi:hypothetical protein
MIWMRSALGAATATVVVGPWTGPDCGRGASDVAKLEREVEREARCDEGEIEKTEEVRICADLGVATKWSDVLLAVDRGVVELMAVAGEIMSGGYVARNEKGRTSHGGDTGSALVDKRGLVPPDMSDGVATSLVE